MQSPVCFVDETGVDVRNRPIKIVKEGTCESPRSELAIADSTECTDERSQSSMSSTETADKEFGPVWGETGEVSPPRSRSSADIPLGQRLGEISPVCDRSSDRSASMETATVSSRLPRPLVFDSEEKELNGSSAIPLSSTCRPFSKEHPPISLADSRGQKDITYEQERKEDILMQAHSQNQGMAGYSTPRAKLEHAHDFVPEIDLAQCDASIVYREKLLKSQSLIHPQLSNDLHNAQLVPLSVLEEPGEGEISAINSNSSDAMSESNLTVPSGSLHSVPSLLYPAGFAEQAYQPGSQAVVNNKKMEDILCSWENFLSEVKSYGQMSPDFVKSLEASLEKTKGELKFETKELASACYSRISTDGDDKECATSPERIAENLVKMKSSLQSHKHCYRPLDIVCDHKERAFPHEEDINAYYQEGTADELSKPEKKQLLNIVNDCGNQEDQLNNVREVRERPLRRCVENISMNDSKKHPGVNVSKNEYVNVSDKKNNHISMTSRQQSSHDSNRTGTQIQNNEGCCSLHVPGWENSPIKTWKSSALKSPPKVVPSKGNREEDKFSCSEEKNRGNIEQSSDLESPLKVNPNKRNTNIPPKYIPKESRQVIRKSNTPNPVTISSNLRDGFGEEQNWVKDICEQGDTNFRGVRNQKQHIPKSGARLQLQDARNSNKRSNEQVEATARPRVSEPQFQHCSFRFFSPGDSSVAKRDSINVVSDENIPERRADIIIRNPEDIIINPNPNGYKPSINSGASSYVEQSSPKLKDTVDRLVLLKPSSRSSVKSSSKASMNRKVKPKARMKVSAEHQGKVIDKNMFSSKSDLPKITPQYASDQRLINPINQNSNVGNISGERKEQILKHQRGSRPQEYQAVYGRLPPYLGRGFQRHLPLPHQHQLTVPNCTYHRDLKSYYTISPGVYRNTFGQSQMSLGHLEVYPKFYPVRTFSCSCHTPLLHYH